MPHIPTASPMLAYCLCGWHASPTCKLQMCYPYVLCEICHVLGHVDLVGIHIEIAGSEGPH